MEAVTSERRRLILPAVVAVRWFMVHIYNRHDHLKKNTICYKPDKIDRNVSFNVLCVNNIYFNQTTFYVHVS